MSETRTLADLAAIIRSKNAGPFRLTFDILFDDEPAFLAVVAADVITPDNVAALFGVNPAQVSSIHVLPEGLAIKITLLRPRAQCAAGETDVYGCQQHVPLMTLPVPLEGNYSPSADTSRIQAPKRAQARLAGGAGPADRKPVSEELIEDRAVAACPESGDLRERS